MNYLYRWRLSLRKGFAETNGMAIARKRLP